MRATLLAGFLTTVDPTTISTRRESRKARLLAAGASVLALAVNPATAMAANASAASQHSEDTIAIDLLSKVDPHFTNDDRFEVTEEERASAEDYASAAVTIPAGVSQSSSVGTAGAGDLLVENSGSILVGALAEATADIGASATAAILGGVLQTVTGGGGAITFDNSGKLEVLAVANADAMGSQETDIAYANALAVGNFAKIGPFVTTTTPTGTGTGTTGTGTTGIIGATALPGSATIQMSNEGTIHVDAVANASADGNAYAFATALYGMVAQATAAGDVDITLANDGDLRVSAMANAVGGHAATAIAQGIGGLVAVANATGTGDAHADVQNSGEIIVRADAHADATTNAWVGALGVTAVWQVAHAAQGDASVSMTNSGSIDVVANAVAEALVAQATALGGAGSIFGGAILQSAAASMGDAYGFFDNGGEISVVANASAHGSVIAYANAYAGPGVIQRAWGGGIASADVGNSGSISVVAHALATATNSALAHVENMFGVMAAATGMDQATAELVNSGEITIAAAAEANGPNWGTADAVLGRAFVVASRANNGDALSQLTNSGAVAVAASALAEGEFAAATAAMMEGIVEQATALGGTAHAWFENSGELAFLANAAAGTVSADGQGTALANATAYNAIAQQVIGMAQTTPSFAVGNATAELANVGTIEVGVHASAEGEAAGNAMAMLSGGIVQTVYTGQFAPAEATASDLLGVASLLNEGDVTLVASAEAAGSSAVALANVVAGISQFASAALGDATLDVTNEGSIAIHAGAEATGGELFSRANAVVYGAFFQSIDAATGSADIAFDNAGDFEVTAGAQASGEEIVVTFAQALGGNQQALVGADGMAEVSFTNGGDYVVHAAAQATLTPADDVTGVTFANAGAQASGLYQFSNNGSVSFANSGTFDIAAGAQSKGTQADGFAMALGVSQSVGGADGTISFTNEGDFSVEAGFQGEGESGGGFVIATGYRAFGEALAVDVENGGDISIIASAEGVEGASAGAVGIALQAAVATSAPGTALLAGSLDNNGDLAVLAFASGGTVMTGTGSTAHEVPGSNAIATGIALLSGVNTMTVSNTGSITVNAVTDHGGGATAYGVRVAGNGTGAPGDDPDIFTLNSSGDIIARVSDDGGKTWQRGTAIDLASAPNPAVVNLTGAGRITGNIALGAGQTINVTNGETWFDGIINAGQSPGAIEAGGQGTLNIGTGGSLYLRYNAVDGSSGASLDAFNMSSTGKLILELPGGASPGSDYPRIMADVANLDGVLLVRIGPKLYKDSVILADLIDADVRNGQFDSCGIDGKRVLLQASCTYDSQGNVDLALTRVKFNAVAGLNASQRGVGSGIEDVYDVGLDGPFADMVEQLFTFDEEDYEIALDQLSGASHAAFLQSFHSLGVRQNELIDRATGCERPGREGSSLSCRAGKVNLWGQIDYTDRGNDGDEDAAGYDADGWTAIVGGDAEVQPGVVIGASLAKLGNRLDFHDGAHSDASGVELGAYGVFDPGNFYAKVMSTIGWFDGDSRRRIDWEPIGGTLVGELTGDSDVRLWTLGAHFGYRLALGESSLLTPFLNIDHSSARLDGFTESGLAGTNLAIVDSTSSQTAATLGVKWAADMGGIVPEVELGYRHRFGDLRSTVHAAFAAEEGSDFDAVSAAEKRGSLLAGLSLGGKVGSVDLRAGYQGIFDGNATSHSANVRIVMPLGGR